MTQNTLTLTLATRLSTRDSKDILTYLKEFRYTYGQIFRSVWQFVNHNHCHFNMSQYNTFLQNKYGILKRTANSIMKDAITKYKAVAQLRYYEKQQLMYRLDSLRNLITYYNKVLIDKQLVEKATNNTVTKSELHRYRHIKRQLYWLRVRKNQCEQRITMIQKEIDSKQYRYCFGTRRLFIKQSKNKKLLSKFRKQRDPNVYYLGAKNESACNAMLQLIPNNDSYIIKLRTHTKEQQFIYGRCKFRYMNNLLLDMLRDKPHGITYRFHFEDNKCYLQAILTIPYAPITTSSENGIVGVDFNFDHLAVTETNKDGNIVNTFVVKYVKQTLIPALHKISDYALQKGKDLAIEELEFNKMRSSYYNTKKLNYIKTFAYSKYKKSMQTICAKKGIQLHKVDPAYTSQLAKTKYCNQRKLTTHQGAAYIIARIAQNLQP